MENCTVSKILDQISKIIESESNIIVSLVPTGNDCMVEGDYSFEIKDVDIPSNVISAPNPKYTNDQNGFYRVNRIRLGKFIFDDAQKGFPFSDEEIKPVIKGAKTWAYYDK